MWMHMPLRRHFLALANKNEALLIEVINNIKRIIKK